MLLNFKIFYSKIFRVFATSLLCSGCVWTLQNHKQTYLTKEQIQKVQKLHVLHYSLKQDICHLNKHLQFFKFTNSYQCTFQSFNNRIIIWSNKQINGESKVYLNRPVLCISLIDSLYKYCTMWFIIIYFSLIWHESTLFYHNNSAGYEMCFKTIMLIFYIFLYIFFYLKFTFISTLIETLKNCLFATNVETNTGMPISTRIYMSNMKGKLYEAKH